MHHTINLRLIVEAASAADAHEAAIGACEHLADTFNDDGSLIEASVSTLEPGTVTLEHRLSDQACYDLICTACEGGINYWADVTSKKRQRHEGSDVPDIISFEAAIQDGPVTCDHPDIKAAEIDAFMIDPGMIRDGIRRLVAPGAEISPAIRNDAVLTLTDEEHAPDADTADAIVQFAVFGELVFG